MHNDTIAIWQHMLLQIAVLAFDFKFEQMKKT